ncbi:MAG TPA: GAF domain-containing protein [Ilumatobacteraceae bacterium]|nr:GAF domain-containing protein [Ilumatobacteraceae bacterium]
MDELDLPDIERCFGGAIPAVLATASAEGVVNVTYLSRAHQVDDERVAVSNQFMSKTSRNLADNPRASLLLMDPLTHDEYRLSLVYERTERRGPVFDRLRADIEALAVLENMQDVYRLRAADVFRVTAIEQNPPNPSGSLPTDTPAVHHGSAELTGLAELAMCIGRAGDLDMLVEMALAALDRLLGYRHTVLLLLDESGTRLYTIGSHGFDEQGVGAEVPLGTGQIGLAAERCEPLRIGGLRQMRKYARSIRQSYEQTGAGPGHEVPVVEVDGVESRIVVPAMARGELIGVLVAESRRPVAFGAADEHILGVVATMLAGAVEHLRAVEREGPEEVGDRPPTQRQHVPVRPDGELAVRFFPVDGSVFLDGDYLIKGVAGRILWSLLRQYVADGRVDFTNRELRLDASLDLPGFKDNLENRLILLKRRLDEREVPIRLEKTGRGRFRLDVVALPRLESVE